MEFNDFFGMRLQRLLKIIQWASEAKREIIISLWVGLDKWEGVFNHLNLKISFDRRGDN